MTLDITHIKIPINSKTSLTEISPYDPIINLEFFENNYPNEIDILKKFNIHPHSGKSEFYDPFNELNCIEDFSNIGCHCIAVASCAAFLVSILKSNNAINYNEAESGIKRALLHDAIKPYEIFLGKALKNGKVSNQAYYSKDIFNRIKPILVSKEIKKEIIDFIVDDIGCETNVRECFFNFWKVEQGKVILKEGNWAKKIVQLADNMTYSPANVGSKKCFFLTTRERLVLAENDTRYPWAEISGLGIQKEELVVLNNINIPVKGIKPILSFHDCLLLNSNLICQEIISISSMQVTSEPDKLLKKLVNQQLNNLDYSYFYIHK